MSIGNGMVKSFKAARRVSTPLIAIQTPDPAATIKVLTALDAEPAIQWDIITGVTAVNEAGTQAVAAITQNVDPIMLTGPAGISLMLEIARDRIPPAGTLYIHMGSRYMDDPSVIQGVWNLRDIFSIDGRALVLLGTAFALPAELGQDVLLLEEPLPDTEQLREIVLETYASVDDGPDLPDAETMDAIVDALVGLAAFPAEQASAMSLKRGGMDVDSLWDRKRAMIEQTPGLRVWRGNETINQVGGLENVKDFLFRLLTGNRAPKAIVFIDEIEKALAGSTGAGGDSSGVSQDYLGQLLTHMQDSGAEGMIAVGPPGSGKSLIAKVAGGIGGIPTIQMDLGGMKGSLVGQSEQALRTALGVVSAMSGGDTLFIATCNKISDLPPELKRRFGLGTFYFDLPSEDERNAIWRIYTPPQMVEWERPDDEGWTGAEIKKCVDIADRLGCQLEYAAGYIVPVAQSAREQIEALRTQANGRFISASYPGVFKADRAGVERATGGRNLRLED